MGDLRDVEDILPPTPMQRAMLGAALADAASAYHHEQFTFLIHGRLDAAAYRRAWQAAIDRHGVLRSVFAWPEGEHPVRVVMRSVPLPWSDSDWSGLDEAERGRALDRVLRDDRGRVFSMTRAPLMRVHLVRLAPELHRVIWSFHHILLDAWSVTIVLDGVAAAYERLARGQAAFDAREVPDVFGECAAWAAEASDFPGAARHWSEVLAGAEPSSGLFGQVGPVPPAPPLASLRVDAVTVPPEVLGPAVRSVRAAGLTLPTLLMGAWGLVLSRFGSGVDVVFGTAVSGRPVEVAGSDGAVGLLMNTVPVRARLGAEARVGEYLHALQRQVRAGAAFEQSSPAIVRQGAGLGPGARLNDSVLVIAGRPVLDAPEGSVRASDYRSFGWTNVPLNLMVVPGESLTIEARTSERVMSPAAVRRMLDHLARAVPALAASLDGPLRGVGTMSESETRVAVRPPSPARPESGTPIHRAFSDVAARRPEATAYRCAGRTRTYAEVSARSAGIAAALREAGVGPGARVGIFAGPSLDLPCALLGVLRVGAAYVPLDPGYPTARLRLIVEDAAPAVVLTDRDDARERLGENVRVVGLSGIAPVGAPPPDADHTVAFVLFTSGSTGRPKGVRCAHTGTMNRFAWMWRELPFAEGESLAWRTSTNFVDHAWEAFGGVLAGVPTEIVTADDGKDAASLVRVLRRCGATRLTVVPSLLDAMIAAEPRLDRALPALRVLVTSGEALGVELAERTRQAAPGVRLVNLYGCTEVAADATWHEVTDGDVAAGVIPIGRAIDGVCAAVLDASLAPVPPGVAGEVYVGGVALAEGYHGRPDLTDERFVSATVPGLGVERLYRTGDVGRVRDDGVLEYLGRSDGQVKIRGVRVETGEVEAALRRVDGVGDASVIGIDAPGGRALGAVYVADAAITATEVRGRLRAVLPEHMVPSFLARVEALPRTPNGKVDRIALDGLLRAAGQAGPSAARGPDGPGPMNDGVRTIAGHFAQVLGRAQVGPDESFFELGGHSLLAVRLAQRIEKDLGLPVPLNLLLTAPTPRSLWAALFAGSASPGTLIGVREGGDSPPLICVHGADGNILFLTKLAAHLDGSVPIFGLAAAGLDGGTPPRRTVDDMAAAYCAAIRARPVRGPMIIAGYSLGGMIAVEAARRLTALGHDVLGTVLIDTRVPRAAAGRSLRKALPQRVAFHLRRGPHALARSIFTAYVQKTAYRACRALGVRPPVAVRALPVRSANLAAYVAHRPQAYTGRLVLVRADHQEDEFRDLPLLGWERVAAGPVDVVSVDAPHMDLFAPAHAAKTSQAVGRAVQLILRASGEVDVSSPAASRDAEPAVHCPV